MASSKPGRKRVISNDREDEGHPPTKRKKKVPEEQLKLERVLKSAAKDKTFIDKIHQNQEEKAKSTEAPRRKSTESKKGANDKSVSVKIKQNIKSVPSRDKSRIEPKGTDSGQSKGNAKESTYFSHSKNDAREEDRRDAKSKRTKVDSSTLPKPSHKGGSGIHKESEYFRKNGHAKKDATSLEKSVTEAERTKKKAPNNSSTSSSKTATKAEASQSRKKTPENSNNSNTSTVTTQSKKKPSNESPKESKNQEKTSTKQNVTSKDKMAKGATKALKDTTKRRREVSPCRPKSEVKKEYVFPKSNNKIGREINPAPLRQDSDSDESDWEEVEDGGIQDYLDPEKSQLPSEPVTITLQGPDLMHKKRKKGQFDLEAFIRRRINRADQELQLHMHKVHLLCLLSHGFHRNRTCLDRELLAHGLSIVPSRLLGREAVHWDVMFLKTVLKWFHDFFTIAHDLHGNNLNLKNILINRMLTREVASEAELVFLMVIILRSLGAPVRLVTSLQPVSHKCSKKLKVRRVKPDAETQEVNPDPPTEPKTKTETKPPEPPEQESEVMAMLKSVEGNGSSLKSDLSKGAKSSVKPSGTPSQKTKSVKRRTCASKVDYKEDDTGKAKGRRKSSTSRGNSPEVIELSSSESDFEEVPTKFRKSPSLSKKGKKTTREEKIVSSDSDDVTVTKVVNKKEIGSDYFLEVYLERAENWIPIDCVRCRVNSAAAIESHATKPMYYVLAYDNDHCIKDVTSRYASVWMSTTRKLRKDEDWWEEVLLPFTPRNKIRDEAENSKLQSQQLRKPLPTSISEFKNHPLYALKRHLLKFEGIYPANAAPVGYIKGEPVYPRECVHELHTRETWLKEGRAVRVKEKPYKMVKARKKRSRKTFEVPVAPQEEQSECFGRWQTEQYMPPPCYNGKVPRNEYGNVEVFKPWMIPAGGVHLQIPGLNKVARKLNIDCAPAMVGWDFHGGFNHPMMDGFIVCEEHKDILLAAWDEEQEIQREKEAEKREQRALANWKKMVKSLILREKMKKRFDLQERKDTGSGSGSQETEEKAQDVQHSWPANRPDSVQKLSTADQSSLFPSEEI